MDYDDRGEKWIMMTEVENVYRKRCVKEEVF